MMVEQSKKEISVMILTPDNLVEDNILKHYFII